MKRRTSGLVDPAAVSDGPCDGRWFVGAGRPYARVAQSHESGRQYLDVVGTTAEIAGNGRIRAVGPVAFAHGAHRAVGTVTLAHDPAPFRRSEPARGQVLMNATPSSSQPTPMRTDRGDLPSPMRTKTVERDIPVRSFTTGPRTVLIAMGRLLPSRLLRPKKTYSRVAGAPVVPPVLRGARPPERHAEQRGSPARGEFYRGTVPAAPTAATGRRTCTQRPLRPRARTRARRQPGRTSGYPADCGSGCPTQCRALHPGAHGLSLRAPMWSRDRPRFPGTLRRGSRDREPPARRRHRFPRRRVVSGAMSIRVGAPGQGRPMEHGAQQTNNAKTGGSRSASRCPIRPGRRRPRHRRTPPTAGALSSGEDGKKAARSDRGRCR